MFFPENILRAFLYYIKDRRNRIQDVSCKRKMMKMPGFPTVFAQKKKEENEEEMLQLSDNDDAMMVPRLETTVSAFLIYS